MILWIKNDNDSMPVKTGNVERSFKLVSKVSLLMLMPQDADFMMTNITRYKIDAAPVKKTKMLSHWLENCTIDK